MSGTPGPDRQNGERGSGAGPDPDHQNDREASGMKTRIVRAAVVGTILAGVAIGTAGCGAPSVPKDEVAKQISAALTKQTGTAPQSVTCPENLPGTVGASVTCTVVGPGGTIAIAAKVAKVEGGKVSLTFAPATP
jgi:Domain of unknown function (DUF4333)